MHPHPENWFLWSGLGSSSDPAWRASWHDEDCPRIQYPSPTRSVSGLACWASPDHDPEVVPSDSNLLFRTFSFQLHVGIINQWWCKAISNPDSSNFWMSTVSELWIIQLCFIIWNPNITSQMAENFNCWKTFFGIPELESWIQSRISWIPLWKQIILCIFLWISEKKKTNGFWKWFELHRFLISNN